MYDAANPSAAVMIKSASVLGSEEGRFETMPVVLLNGMIPLLHGGGVRESTPERTQGSIDGLDRVFRHDGIGMVAGVRFGLLALPILPFEFVPNPCLVSATR